MFAIFLAVFILLAPQAVAKSGRVDVHAALGSSLLLMGTSSAQKIEDILKGTDLVARNVSHLSADERNFLFGYANYRLEKWKEAEDFLKKCRNSSLFDDYVLFYRGRIALELDDYERAREFLARLVSEEKGSVFHSEAKKYLAEALIGLGSFDEARKLLSEYLKIADLPIETFDANLLLAKSYKAQGDDEQATAILRHMATSVIGENELRDIANIAGPSFEKWLKEPRTQYAIAESLMEHSQWSDALAHLENALASTSDDFETRWLYARCHFKAHNYSKVIPLLEKLLKDRENGNFRLTLLQHQASAYARIDDYDHSIDLRRKIIREYPNNASVVLDSQSKIAFLLLDDGHYKEAIDEFEKVLKLKGSASLRAKTLWYMAWSYYNLKDYDSAMRIMGELQKGRSRKSKVKMDDRIAYWKARSLENQGRRAQAEVVYRGILNDHPIGYYGVLSKRRLEGDKRDAKNFGEAGAHKWPKGRFSVTVPNPDSYLSSPHLAKAIVFNNLDLHEEVAKELKASIGDGKAADTNLLLWLADKNFAPDLSYAIANQRYSQLLRSLPRSDGFQRFVWEQSYPEAYKPVVEKLIDGRVDSKLVYSIMRAESNFRPAVVSPAGAVGLMQLMPVTAQRMAEEIGESEFDAHELYRPAKNIEYGVQYLKKLSGLFPQNTVAVIASYNAGEEAVGRWLKHGYSTDIEEFIEEIPYDETNLYVKKVLMTYWILQQMYPG